MVYQNLYSLSQREKMEFWTNTDTGVMKKLSTQQTTTPSICIQNELKYLLLSQTFAHRQNHPQWVLNERVSEREGKNHEKRSKDIKCETRRTIVVRENEVDIKFFFLCAIKCENKILHQQPNKSVEYIFRCTHMKLFLTI